MNPQGFPNPHLGTPGLLYYYKKDFHCETSLSALLLLFVHVAAICHLPKWLTGASIWLNLPRKNATARRSESRFPKRRRSHFSRPCICMRASIHGPMWHGDGAMLEESGPAGARPFTCSPAWSMLGRGRGPPTTAGGLLRSSTLPLPAATKAWRPINADGQDGWHVCVPPSGGRSKHMSTSRNQNAVTWRSELCSRWECLLSTLFYSWVFQICNLNFNKIFYHEWANLCRFPWKVDHILFLFLSIIMHVHKMCNFKPNIFIFHCGMLVFIQKCFCNIHVMSKQSLGLTLNWWADVFLMLILITAVAVNTVN